MTSYVHDGTVFDLDRRFVDVVGVEWRWTGQRNEAGEPLMRSFHRTRPHPDGALPLPDVYHDHGPLIPMPDRPAAALKRAVLTGAVTAP